MSNVFIHSAQNRWFIERYAFYIEGGSDLLSSLATKKGYQRFRVVQTIIFCSRFVDNGKFLFMKADSQGAMHEQEIYQPN